MFCIGGTDPYQETNAERLLGGGGAWNDDDNDEMEEEEKEEDGEAMDQSNDAVDEAGLQADPENQGGEVTFPEPNLKFLVYDAQGSRFYFDASQLPGINRVKGVKPELLKAFVEWSEGQELIDTAIASQPALPMPVHASPLGSFLSNHGSANHHVWGSRVISFSRSCSQLLMFKILVENRVILTDPTITDEIFTLIHAKYYDRLTAITHAIDTQLDALYAKSQEQDADSIATFLTITETFSLQYIHLLESHLHALLIAPYATIPIEAMLTPNVTPSLNDCQVCGVATDVIKDMQSFFASKLVLATNSTAQRPRQAPPSTIPTEADAADSWRGYIPRATLLWYMKFMNIADE